MRVLFATAELAPFVKVGGLGDASAGLVTAMRRRGLEVQLVLPDYGGLRFRTESEETVAIPDWGGPTTVRHGALDGFESVSLVDSPGIQRPHPYVDEDGTGWHDNDYRFFAFSAAVAELASRTQPDLIHLNDWHTGPVLGFLESPPPSVLTIHNLAYQGNASDWWLQHIPHRPEAFEWYGGVNPLSGAIALADLVATVSPSFAAEALLPETGFGLHEALAAKGERFTGIINGIEVDVWDPAADPFLDLNYDTSTVSRKRQLGRRLAEELGWEPDGRPIVGMVSRLTDQKGVDIALEVAEAMPSLGARMVLLGSGDRLLAELARDLAMRLEGHVAFKSGYDEALSHRIFAGSDLLLMPSRFEPCGLAQMQAMRYGTIPVVTAVGGLRDTVIDADEHPETGTGFVASEANGAAVGDALGRALRAWRSTRRRGPIRRRGMTRDWSWDGPADRYLDWYQVLASS